MAFQTKAFLSIVASMVNHMRSVTTKITDYNVGSVARTLVEAPAIEIDELYQQMVNGLTEAIPVSVYTSFGFPALDAAPATGLIRVTVTPLATTRLIPAGATFRSDAASTPYAVITDTTVPASTSFVDVPVAASTAGAAGNVAAGLSFTLDSPLTGFVSATNLSALLGGADAETDDARKLRFNAYISTLSRATGAALDYGLRLATVTNSAGLVTERVASTAIVEPYLTDSNQPVGWVKAYIHNGVGATSSALVNRAAQILLGYTDTDGTLVPGWKAAGVKVDVLAAPEQSVAVTLTLNIAAGYDAAALSTAAQQAVYGYLLGLGIGARCLRAEIIALLMGIDGVTNVTLTTPAADVAPTTTTKLMPGSITITTA